MEKQKDYRPRIEELHEVSTIEENMLAMAVARGSYKNLNDIPIKKQRPMTAKVLLSNSL